MAIHYNTVTTHWNYFLALEEDFSRVSRFVEPCEANENTYSIEFARILMTASQEVDVILKALCKQIDPHCTASSITSYFNTINSTLPSFLQETVHLPRYGLHSIPWQNWTAQSPPHWWTANNKIKHHRHTHFSQATMKHSYNALAGLYVAIAYYQRQGLTTNSTKPRWTDVMNTLDSNIKLFRLKDSYYYKTLAIQTE